MPLTVAASGIDQAAASFRGFQDAVNEAAISAGNAAVKAGQQAAIETTVDRYNVTAEQIAPYVTAQLASQGKAGASVTLKVRAIPLETFNPIVRMQRFDFRDKKGRHVSRLLPAVYFARLRGDAPKYLRPAFPLHQRTSGALSGGDRIVKRTGKARDKLTTFRFYTFPDRFLDTELIPAVQDAMPAGFRADFKIAERLANGRLRNNKA